MIELLAICVYSYFSESDVSIDASALWCANFTSVLTIRKVEGVESWLSVV